MIVVPIGLVIMGWLAWVVAGVLVGRMGENGVGELSFPGRGPQVTRLVLGVEVAGSWLLLSGCAGDDGGRGCNGEGLMVGVG